MLDQTELSTAFEFHRRAFGLLRWLEASVSDGYIDPAVAHKYADQPAEAAVKWLDVYYDRLPLEFRPPTTGSQDLLSFANMLSSYLLTSFDYTEYPAGRLVSPTGCYCPCCMYTAAGRRFSPKKLTTSDKQRATRLKIDYLLQLAAEGGASLSEPAAQQLADDPEFFEAVAMATYGRQLLLRIQGQIEGPAILALWRQFAWERTGSPKKNFKLEAAAVVAAEMSLRNWLVSRPSSP